MSVDWNSRYNPQYIIDHLESIRKVDSKGNVSYSGFEFREFSVYLYDFLDLPNEIPEVEGRSIVNQSIMNAGKKCELTSKSIIKEINKEISAYFQKKISIYFLTTTISLDKYHPPNSVQLRGNNIIFDRNLPNTYQKYRDSILEDSKRVIYTDPPKDYLPVRIRVEARTIFEASKNALETLDEIRGIWNLYLNRGQKFRMSFGSREPVNKILLGPIHTLHKPHGKPATDIFWFEPNYRAPIKTFRFSTNADKIDKYYKFVQLRLRQCAYQYEIRSSIISYLRALDDRDWHASYLKLWSVLENLTATNPGDSYNVTIRRASHVFLEYDYVKENVKVLRDHRNRVVHASATSDEIETYLYQLKNIVEALIELHLTSTYGFKSINHFNQFLDLPVEKDQLEEKANLISYTQKYRGYIDR